MKLRDFIPPILLDLTRRMGLCDTQKIIPGESYSSYQDALLECGKSIFSEDEYAELILYKTKVFWEELNTQPYMSLEHSQLMSLISILLSIQESGGNKILRVIDVGGAAGTQYFLLRRFLRSFFSDDLKISWHVVETTASVQASRELANDELRFFSSISSACRELDNVDLVYTASALQCLPDPKRYLSEMVQCDAELIYFGSIGLTLEQKKVIALHRANFELAGPKPLPLPAMVENIEYKVPFTFMPKNEFDEILGSKYRVEIQIQDDMGIFAVPGKKIVGWSILAKRVKGKFRRENRSDNS